MTDTHAQLTESEKKRLFWASFLSLAAAGFGFAFRVAKGGAYGGEFELTNLQIGLVFGASLWPIAISMIGFSLALDKTGFKKPMFWAFALQTISVIGTALAPNYAILYVAALCAGLGHGIVEAVINPVCAAIYQKEKTKRLTILHAAWPFGLVFGTLPIIGLDAMMELSWRAHAWWMLIPVVAYGIMFIPCRFPVDERVQAGVPFMAMLKEVGFLTAFLAGGLMIYEIGNQMDLLTPWTRPQGASWFYISMGLGALVGGGLGLWTKSIGKPLFFLMCLMMIPVATAELGTDGWIKKLMTPVLSQNEIDPAFALVFSASIMMILRIYAGPILKLGSPPTILAISGIGSAVGLYWLSSATGMMIFVAFVIYALGQTYYWPCVLGFVSERYPQGGALTLNTVSAVGLLSVGIIGAPVLGVAFDKSIHDGVTGELPELAEVASKDDGFLWTSHQSIDPAKKDLYLASLVKPYTSSITELAQATAPEKVKAVRETVPETNPAWEPFNLSADDLVAYKAIGKLGETLTEQLPEEARAAAAQVGSTNATYSEIDNRAGRDVLVFAAIFPGSLIIIFGAIAIWFKMKGGYTQVNIEDVAQSGGSEL